MTFYLKKIISHLLEPLSAVFLLLVLSLWLLYKNRRKYAALLTTFALALLFLLGYRPFAYALMHPLESRYEKLQNPPADIPYIVFIGGDLERRGWELLRLHHLLPKATVITSGYEGIYFEKEALRNKRIFSEVGIDPKQIIALPEPKDTIEEAKAIKKLLGDKPFILITAAYHMPRAMMIFEHEGLHPLAAPADFMRESKWFWLTYPSAHNLRYTERALHEYIGIVWLKVKGY